MKAFLTTLLFIPPMILAQNYQGMSQEDMQRMMQQAQKAQACMQKIDQSKLQALGSEAEQVEAEIKDLCKKGKRAAAEKKAYVFAKKMNTSPEVKAARKCSEMMRGLIPSMGFIDKASKKKSDKHICDDMK